jgi:small subunit ribosomal protein S8
MNHLLWNLYTRIKNGQLAKKIKILQPKTKLCEKFLNILWKEGYITSFNVSKEKPEMFEIILKYNRGEPAIKNIVAISKPSKRIYVKVKDLWKLSTGLHMLIISTTSGLITDQECKKLHLGGELFCIIS